MKTEEKIERIIEPIIGAMGYDLVRVMLIGSVNPTLQIMIERKDLKPIVIEDCVKASKAISPVLDEKLEDDYNLEVSSPGVDRPLVKPEHFKRFIGSEAKIETHHEVEKRKRFKGKLVAAGSKEVEIEMAGIVYKIAFENIAKAKLVLSDEN